VYAAVVLAHNKPHGSYRHGYALDGGTAKPPPFTYRIPYRHTYRFLAATPTCSLAATPLHLQVTLQPHMLPCSHAYRIPCSHTYRIRCSHTVTPSPPQFPAVQHRG
jgi:hypothetical protein